MPNVDGSLTVAEQLGDLRQMVLRIEGRLDTLAAAAVVEQQGARLRALEMMAARFTEADIRDAHTFRQEVSEKLAGLEALANYKRWIAGLVVGNTVTLACAIFAAVLAVHGGTIG